MEAGFQEESTPANATATTTTTTPSTPDKIVEPATTSDTKPQKKKRKRSKPKAKENASSHVDGSEGVSRDDVQQGQSGVRSGKQAKKEKYKQRRERGQFSWYHIQALD